VKGLPNARDQIYKSREMHMEEEWERMLAIEFETMKQEQEQQENVNQEEQEQQDVVNFENDHDQHFSDVE
jgi:hypothetical protein